VSFEANYKEDRDALAQDWSYFFSKNYPNVQWMPIPNLGEEVCSFVHQWGLEGYILTGGNDLGQSPLRDDTERRLIAYAVENGQPILGVCRGMQMLNQFFGGSQDVDKSRSHIAIMHNVDVSPAPPLCSLDGRFEVNSFHSYVVRDSQLATQLHCFAKGTDGTIEGLMSLEQKIVGIQWHPERMTSHTSLDQHLLLSLFGWSTSR